jgi:anti-anti-sigma factor
VATGHSHYPIAELARLMHVFELGMSATAREAPQLLQAARDAAASTEHVTVDCAGTERCDVAGLQVLLALRADLNGRGGELRVINVRASLQRRFELVGLAHEAVSAGNPSLATSATP